MAVDYAEYERKKSSALYDFKIAMEMYPVGDDFANKIFNLLHTCRG